MHFFRVRMSDYYVIAVEGVKEKVTEVLRKRFPEVKFLRTEKLDSDAAKRCHGNRVLDGVIIRGCYFTAQFGARAC